MPLTSELAKKAEPIKKRDKDLYKCLDKMMGMNSDLYSIQNMFIDLFNKVHKLEAEIKKIKAVPTKDEVTIVNNSA